MEPLFLILVAVLLFTQSWYLLRLYADPRTVGVIAAALALGLLAVASGQVDPVEVGATAVPLTAAMQGVAVLWAVYAAGLAAHALWDFEDRALGPHSLVLLVATLVLGALPWLFGEDEISTIAALLVTVASIILAVLVTLLFFHITFRIQRMKAVTAWSMVVGSTMVGFLGVAIYFTSI